MAGSTVADTIEDRAGRAAEIGAEVVAAARLPLEEAVTLPAAAYTDPEFHRWEMERIFRREWLAVAHVSQLPKAGDYLALDVAGEPIVVVRGKDERVRVLSRVCKHRGMDIMPEGYGHPERGNKRVLLCPYHFWGYDLDGQLKGAPEMHQACGFNRKDVRLHEHRSEIWEGFVFVSFSDDPAPVAERLSGLKERFAGRWRMEETVCVWEKSWPSPFNWKVLAENFMEPYHHLGSHSTTLQPMMPAKGCWTEPPEEHWCAVHLPLKQNLVESNAGGRGLCTFAPFPGMAEEDFAQWWLFLAFPTFLLFSAADRFYWYRLVPTGPETSELVTSMFVHPSAMSAPDYEETLAREIEQISRIHTEDIEACVGVQRGMSSLGWSQGRLSHLEEPIWHIQRYLARELGS